MIAPIAGYPLSYPREPLTMIQQIAPVFIGYMALGARFFVQGNIEETPNPRTVFLLLLLNLFFFVFLAIFALVIIGFGYSNSHWADPGSGMTLDDFSLITSITLSLLTGTIGTLAAYAFKITGE